MLFFQRFFERDYSLDSIDDGIKNGRKATTAFPILILWKILHFPAGN